MARAIAVLVPQFPGEGDGSIRQEFPADSRHMSRWCTYSLAAAAGTAVGSRQGYFAVWESWKGHVYYGLSVPSVCVSGFRDMFKQLRHKIGM